MKFFKAQAPVKTPDKPSSKINKARDELDPRTTFHIHTACLL